MGRRDASPISDVYRASDTTSIRTRSERIDVTVDLQVETFIKPGHRDWHNAGYPTSALPSSLKLVRGELFESPLAG